ncbi:uncharacterized protein LOC113343063 [Papaver somniferum]|uniref:uncharacterized protein LOC113343063 n=1 Tax=Papaver somniferum TaxID=3469 RepID=UPI000E6FBA37|nr:uncharacterized protein LOC113343063 [Papaver somniferum]
MAKYCSSKKAQKRNKACFTTLDDIPEEKPYEGISSCNTLFAKTKCDLFSESNQLPKNCLEKIELETEENLKLNRELDNLRKSLSEKTQEAKSEQEKLVDIPNQPNLSEVNKKKEGCDIWKFSLIGRLDFKGINFQDVKNSFEQQWQLGQGRVQFIPMNRGFYIIKLQSMEDRDRILNVEAWMFEQQKLNLMEWFHGFDAEKHNTSHATVWVKFPGLPVEYWIEKNLLAFGKSLGTPVVVYKGTLDHEYGYYASVLIDINFAELDTDGIHIMVGGRDFWQPIEIQKRPKFRTKCKIIGHVDSKCRKNHKNLAGNPL